MGAKESVGSRSLRSPLQKSSCTNFIKAVPRDASMIWTNCLSVLCTSLHLITNLISCVLFRYKHFIAFRGLSLSGTLCLQGTSTGKPLNAIKQFVPSQNTRYLLFGGKKSLHRDQNNEFVN